MFSVSNKNNKIQITAAKQRNRKEEREKVITPHQTSFL
jgi:hypothetical protein